MIDAYSEQGLLIGLNPYNVSEKSDGLFFKECGDMIQFSDNQCGLNEALQVEFNTDSLMGSRVKSY